MIHELFSVLSCKYCKVEELRSNKIVGKRLMMKARASERDVSLFTNRSASAAEVRRSQ